MRKRIIFDLEWNYSRQRPTFDYHGQALFLHGELIQIGAVDADSGEEFSCLVRPRLLPKLNPFVAQLTGLSQEKLESGMEAGAALRAFRDWCGEDALLLSWSGQDPQILKENLFLNGFGEEWPRQFGDVQRIFRDYSGSEKWEPPLMEAAEHFGIEGDFRWHDALSDARCAAVIYSRMDKPAVPAAEMEDFRWRNCEEVREFRFRLSQDSWKLDPELCEISCPVCGAPMTPADHWQNSPENRYWYSLLTCPCGEQRLIYWAGRREYGLRHFLRGIAQPDRRQLRDWAWRYRKARRKK